MTSTYVSLKYLYEEGCINTHIIVALNHTTILNTIKKIEKEELYQNAKILHNENYH